MKDIDMTGNKRRNTKMNIDRQMKDKKTPEEIYKERIKSMQRVEKLYWENKFRGQ